MNLIATVLFLLFLNLGMKFELQGVEISINSLIGQLFLFYVIGNIVSVIIYLSQKNILSPEIKVTPCTICGEIMYSTGLTCPNKCSTTEIHKKE
jgi:hypothetical protein